VSNLRPLPNATPLHQQADTQSRLAALGLKEATLHDALRYAYSESERCSGNDVNSAAGYAKWGKPLRFLRDHLLPEGWMRGGQPQLESLVSPDGKFRITSSTGNFATGDLTKMVATAGLKGRLALEAIGDNGQTQFDIFGESAEVMPPVITYYYLHYLDEKKEEIRSELSIPTHMTIRPKAKKGRIDEFKDRLALKPIAFDLDADLDHGAEAEDFSEDLDIPVPRRAASE
jgi:hypothetical protein